MTNLLRMATLAASAAVLAATPATAAPVGSSNGNASATARILKPLTLTHTQDLNMGDITLTGAGTWSGQVVTLNADGTLVCGGNVACSGATSVAIYNVTGTQNQVVSISVPSVVMNHATITGATLTLTPQVQSTVTLANSGAPGSDFPIGGSISLASSTPDGVYTGTFNVTVDY